MVTRKLMFDIGWSELLILGIMALIVVGPKDLPVLLRTLGRYLGMIRRQATEFRQQFDDVLRDTEIDQIRKDMAGIRNDVSSTMHQATKQVERELEAGKVDLSAKETLEKKTAGTSTAGASEAREDPSDLVDEPTAAPAADTPPTAVAAAPESSPRVQGSSEKSGA